MNQSYNTVAVSGNSRESSGSGILLKLDDDQWEVIEDALDKSDNLVSDQVIMRELGVSKKTLCNLISSGKISRDMYTVLPNKRKQFFWDKVMGLKK